VLRPRGPDGKALSPRARVPTAAPTTPPPRQPRRPSPSISLPEEDEGSDTESLPGLDEGPVRLPGLESEPPSPTAVPTWSPSPERAAELREAASAAAESLSRWPSPPPPARKSGLAAAVHPRILAGMGVRAAAAATCSIAGLTAVLEGMRLHDAERAVEEAREALAAVQVSGPHLVGRWLKLVQPLGYACSLVSPGEDPIHRRVVTASLIPRDMDEEMPVVSHCAGVISEVRGCGHNVTHAYVGKSSVSRWPRARLGDRSPPRSRARKGGARVPRILLRADAGNPRTPQGRVLPPRSGELGAGLPHGTSDRPPRPRRHDRRGGGVAPRPPQPRQQGGRTLARQDEGRGN